MAKVLDTATVVKINKKPGNRRISNEGVRLLDPDGKHVFSPVMDHKNDIRGHLYMKFRGKTEPVMVFFDIPAKDHAKLEDAVTHV